MDEEKISHAFRLVEKFYEYFKSGSITNNTYLKNNILMKFSFNFFTGRNNIYPIQDNSQIIIIDKPEKLPSEIIFFSNFYLICFDYKLFIMDTNILDYLLSYLSPDKNSEIHCFPSSFPQIQHNYKINYIADDIKFKEEIDNFHKKFKIVSNLNSKIKDVLYFWNMILKSISAFLIKKAYSNSKFDVIKHSLGIFDQKATEKKINDKKFIKLRNINISNSSVELIYHIPKELLLAKKIFNDDIIEDLYQNELSSYLNIQHPLIPQFYGVTNEGKRKCIVICFLDGTTLNKMDEMNLSKEMKVKFLFEILIIFKYIHSKGFIYRDLRPDNIMIVYNFLLFLFDFDRMIHVSNINEKNELFKGFGHYYYAPEIESENAITQKVDIYSIGKIMHFLLMRNKKGNDFIQENLQLNEIYGQCIEKCPEKRPNISSLIKLLYECFFCKITKVSETKSIKLINNINSRTSFSFLLFLSDYKNEYAQYYLGKFYEKGKYLIKNIGKAIHYYLLSAQQNNGKAKRKLISLFNKIDLSFLNDDDKHQYLVLAANENILEAQYQLSILYLEGKYGDENIIKAIKYLSKAANQNHVESQYQLGFIYYEGKYIIKDVKLSICYLSKASYHNHSKAQYQLGVIYYENQNFEDSINQSIHYLLLSAQQDNENAKKMLKSIFEEVDVCSLSVKTMVLYLKFSAEESIPEAQFQLGILYLEGKHVEQNIDKSINYLSEAANQSHVEAQYKLGKIYNEEKYVARDIFQAETYFSMAATQNHVKSQCKLNEMKNDQINYEKQFNYFSSNDISEVNEYHILNTSNNINDNKEKESDICFMIDDNKNNKLSKKKKKKVEEIAGILLKERNKKEGLKVERLSTKYVKRIKKRNKIKKKKQKHDNFVKEQKENEENRNYVEMKILFDLQILLELKKELLELLFAAKSIFEKVKQKHFAGNVIEFMEAIELFLISQNEQIQPLVNTIIETSNSIIEIINENNFLINDEKSTIVQMVSILNKIIEDIQDNCSFISSLKNLVSFYEPDKFYEIAIDYYEGNKGPENVKESIQYFTKAADLNHRNAQYHLGIIYSDDNIVKKDIDMAIKYLTLAANQDHQEAQYRLGIILYDNKKDINLSIYFLLSVAKNNNEAKQKLKSMFNEVDLSLLNTTVVISFLMFLSYENIASAQYKLGMIYREGKIIKQDINESMRYLLLAAQQKHKEAIYQLGMIHLSYFNDIKKSVHYFFKAAKLNHTDAQYQLGMIYIGIPGFISISIDFLKSAADSNHTQAQYALGNIFYCNKLVERDIQKAIHYLTLAADQNDINAQYQLGMIYLNDIKDKFDLCIHYLTKAASLNHIDAQYQLGIIYLDIPELIKKSIDFLRQAADSNHPQAQYKLGLIYYEASHVEMDIQKAIHYLTLASLNGIADAYYILSIIYSDGKFVEKEKTKALHCLIHAAELNHQEAKKKLDKINDILFE